MRSILIVICGTLSQSWWDSKAEQMGHDWTQRRDTLLDNEDMDNDNEDNDNEDNVNKDND